MKNQTTTNRNSLERATADTASCDHEWSENKTDLNNETYRICKNCKAVDDSQRTPEYTV